VPSAPLVHMVARHDVDLVHSVPVSCRLTKDRAMLTFELDPRDRKPVFLGAATEFNSDFVADRDPRGQIDVVILSAGTDHEPVATFGQHT